MSDLKMPVLFKARVMRDGAAFITIYGEQIEVKFKNGVVQVDLDRDDMSALRDVLSIALAES